MPEKSVREMSERERKAHSIGAHVFNVTVVGSLILGLVAFVMGFGMYWHSMVMNYVDLGMTLTNATVRVADKASVDIAGVSEQVMDLYNSLPEEAKANPDDPAYLALYDEITGTQEYFVLKTVLDQFRQSADIEDIYVAMYQEEGNRLIYIADPSPDDPCAAGYWDTDLAKTEARDFLNWDGEGRFYKYSNNETFGPITTCGVPLKNSSGETIAFVLADITMENVFHSLKSFVWQFLIAVLIATAIFAYIFSNHLKKRFADPINQIADAAQTYFDDRQNQASENRTHFANLDIHTGDEIENLAVVMADMEADAAAYFDELMSVTVEKERISSELDLATRIQNSVLPNIFPPFPERSEFEIFCSMDPAKEVGGDFYDFFMLDNRYLALVVADVSGKGIPAALFMMISRTMLKDAVISGLDPAAALERVNSQLAEMNQYYMFVTVWLGILDFETGRLVYADAGHEQLLLCHDGEWQLSPRKGGVALGVLEPEILAAEKEPVFVNKEIVLAPGDMIYQYTDGVTEAMTADREQFGMERLLDAAQKAPSCNPQDFLVYIREKIDEFVQDAPQFDDITMLGLQYFGKKE